MNVIYVVFLTENAKLFRFCTIEHRQQTIMQIATVHVLPKHIILDLYFDMPHQKEYVPFVKK